MTPADKNTITCWPFNEKAGLDGNFAVLRYCYYFKFKNKEKSLYLKTILKEAHIWIHQLVFIKTSSL